jgi:hypothetical protein
MPCLASAKQVQTPLPPEKEKKERKQMHRTIGPSKGQGRRGASTDE